MSARIINYLFRLVSLLIVLGFFMWIISSYVPYLILPFVVLVFVIAVVIVIISFRKALRENK
ncbi:hypothetical protein HMPREF1207_05115 [Paenibacillus sp. HGH0039]|nr:hypothetical protein HMPREF1207_05115 [Paenibacillus sp. HGH0039]